MARFEDWFELTCITDKVMGENCYVLHKKGSQDALVIDPGFQVEEVLGRLDQKSLTCDLVLVTHGHVDHVAGVPTLKRKGIEVRMHSADQSLLSMTLNIPGVTADPVEIEGQLEEGNMEWHGVPIQIIHVPGHSLGSVCYLIADTLFSGDVLFRRSVGRTDLPGGSFGALEGGIRLKLYTLPEETVVLPGHGEPTTIGEEKAENPFVPGRSDAIAP